MYKHLSDKLNLRLNTAFSDCFLQELKIKKMKILWSLTGYTILKKLNFSVFNHSIYTRPGVNIFFFAENKPCTMLEWSPIGSREGNSIFNRQLTLVKRITA